MAANITDSSVTTTYGSEALVSATVANDFTVLNLGVTSIVLGAEYSVGDTIKISISGGTFDIADTIVLTDANGAGITVGITAGLLSKTATELLFRITALDTTNGLLTNGEILSLNVGAAVLDVKLDATTVGSTVSLTAASATSTGLAIDITGAKDTFLAGTVIKQHAFSIAAPMNTKIDVAKARKEFETPANSTFAIAYAQTAPLQAGMTITATTYSVNGSMTGFEASIAAATNDGTVTGFGAAVYTVAADLQSASRLLAAVPVASETTLFTVDPTAADRVVLNIGNYTADVKIAEVGGKSFTYTGITAGAMSLNGSSAQYGYVPVNFDGAVTTQFEVGNKGTVDGEITLSGFDTDGNVYSAILPFKAMAGKLTKISDFDISTAFALTAGTKLNLTITINAPDADVTYGAYSNRGTTGRMAINKL